MYIDTYKYAVIRLFAYDKKMEWKHFLKANFMKIQIKFLKIQNTQCRL